MTIDYSSYEETIKKLHDGPVEKDTGFHKWEVDYVATEEVMSIAEAGMKELLERCKRLEAALTKFVAWHDMDHDSMKGREVQESYDKAIGEAVRVLKEQGK